MPVWVFRAEARPVGRLLRASVTYDAPEVSADDSALYPVTTTAYLSQRANPVSEATEV
jgi:hypothetical protein